MRDRNSGDCESAQHVAVTFQNEQEERIENYDETIWRK